MSALKIVNLFRAKSFRASYYCRKNHVVIKETNFYDLLGVPRDASLKLIDETYQTHLRCIHKDALQLPEVKTHIKQLETARGVLKDPKLRQRYDLDLEVSDNTQRYIKNVLPGVTFARPPIKPPAFQDIFLDRDFSKYQESSQLEELKKLKQSPAEFIHATTYASLAPRNNAVIILWVTFILALLGIGPDLAIFCFQHFDSIKNYDHTWYI